MSALWSKGMGIVNRKVFAFYKEIMPVPVKSAFSFRAILIQMRNSSSHRTPTCRMCRRTFLTVNRHQNGQYVFGELVNRQNSTMAGASEQVPSVTEVVSPINPASPVTEATTSLVNPSFSLPEVTGPLPDVSLEELGLGGYTPVGMVQNILEFMHVDLGLPWWGAIVSGTILARCLVFPLIVKGQREAAKLNNYMPQMTTLTNKMNEAKRSGNKFEFSKAYSDLMLFQKKHDINPLRGFLVPMVQAPVFISFFIALRKMAYLPVPSMQTGGLWWFSDLTVADPYYILPLAVTVSMWGIIELGAESGVNNPNLQTMKTVFRIMPLIILPLTINFPTAVFTYWMTSNVFSLAQVAFLNIPEVRKKLKIPERVQHDPSVLPKNEGFIKSLKKGWKNAQLAQQLEERERKIKHHLDIAAKGPLRQTFAQNPLQQKEGTHVSISSIKKGKKKSWEDPLD